MVFYGEPLYRRDLNHARMVGEEIVAILNDEYDRAKSALIPDLGLEVTEADRQMLNRWLSKLHDVPTGILKEIAVLATSIKPPGATIQANVSKGDIRLWAAVPCHPVTTPQALAYAVAGLLSAGFRENFSQCPWCEKWIFDIPSGRPKKVYCSPKHSNSFRQRKHKENQL